LPRVVFSYGGSNGVTATCHLCHMTGSDHM